MKKIDLGILSKNLLTALAVKIAKTISNHDIIILKGDLGSGKTFFTKNFINSFYTEKVNVISPSFNIVQTYETNLFTIWHFDLYRLKSKEEIFNIGIEQAFDEGVSIIEWPEMIEDILPDDYLEVNLNFAEDESERFIYLNLYGKWETINFIK